MDRLRCGSGPDTRQVSSRGRSARVPIEGDRRPRARENLCQRQRSRPGRCSPAPRRTRRSTSLGRSAGELAAAAGARQIGAVEYPLRGPAPDRPPPRDTAPRARRPSGSTWRWSTATQRPTRAHGAIIWSGTEGHSSRRKRTRRIRAPQKRSAITRSSRNLHRRAWSRFACIRASATKSASKRGFAATRWSARFATPMDLTNSGRSPSNGKRSTPGASV